MGGCEPVVDRPTLRMAASLRDLRRCWRIDLPKRRATGERARKDPSLKIKLAAALLQMKRCERTLAANVDVDHPAREAKTLTADEIIARFQFDHYRSTTPMADQTSRGT